MNNAIKITTARDRENNNIKNLWMNNNNTKTVDK